MKMFFGAALACLATPALGASQIDVNNLVLGSAAQGYSAGTPYPGGIMQTWTVGTSGKLTQLDLFTDAYVNGARNPALRAVLEIYDAGQFGLSSSDITSATLKGLVSMPLNAAPNGNITPRLQSIDLSSLNIVARRNQRLAFRMLTPCAGCGSEAYWVNWNVMQISQGPNGYVQPTSNGYAGGNFFQSGGGSAYYKNDTADLNFRTWVDASVAVPEPATWASLIVGFGLAGTAVRRRRETGQIVRVTT